MQPEDCVIIKATRRCRWPLSLHLEGATQVSLPRPPPPPRLAVPIRGPLQDERENAAFVKPAYD